MHLTRGGMFDTSTGTISHDEEQKYGGVLEPTDWERRRGLTSPNVAVMAAVDRRIT